MSDIIQRLRCKYPMGPIGDNGEPEFGWRDFRGPAPEGVVLPTPLMLEAANALDAQAAEISQARKTADYWKAEHNAANDEIARLRDALSSIRQYGNDTLSGRADGGPDDRKWQREAVIEMRNRARAALQEKSNG